MKKMKTMTKPLVRRLPLLATAAAAVMLTAVSASADTAHTVRPGWGEWWLPYNYSKHGVAFDQMFNFIFWLTTIILIVVQVVLVIFLFKYKFDPNKKKGVFIHGNTRLEMVWTLIPAVFLAGMALASKGIWDRYRYAEEYDHSPQTEVLVIGEQFQWNFVYPGKDGKFGQYMAYAQPSDPAYRKLKYEEAMKKINADIIDNPLGQNQNWEDLEAKPGQDDDYDHNPGRPLILPVNKPIAVRLSAKDVIHDFFLPNFRVKLDALPGMLGRINFTAIPEAQSTEDLSLDEPKMMAAALKAEKKEGNAYKIWIDSDTPGAIMLKSAEVSQVNYALNGRGRDGNVLQVKSREDLSPDRIAALKAAGITRVTAVTKSYELVCEELCGQGHYKMQGNIYFVSPAQYEAFIQKKEPSDAVKKQPGLATAIQGK